MRLGFGLYRAMLNSESYRFARQCGATDIVVHLCDYGVKSDPTAMGHNQPVGDKNGYGIADHPGLWELDEVLNIKKEIEDHGLRFFAVENFDPAQWFDVLLGGPKRDEQLELLKQQIQIFGQAGIDTVGYDFTLTGVTGRIPLTTRGGAETVGLKGVNSALSEPLKQGYVWNMCYDPQAPDKILESTEEEELWDRLDYFLKYLVPVAEEAGITLAAHPDDPPLEMVKGQPKLIYRHKHYQRLLDLVQSSSNQLEMCLGTLSEMQDEDLYRTIENYVSQGKVSYIHLRNVEGKVPHYTEKFIDDGDIDVGRVIRILNELNFEGVIIPDHSPKMSCPAPWHAGMAFAMGYIKSKIDELRVK